MAKRFEELAESDLTDAQRAVVHALVSGPRGVVQGPFVALLRNPGLASRIEKVGEFLRFGGLLPKHLTELAILVVSEAWLAPFEWQIHAPLALKAGISPLVIENIGAGLRPDRGSDPEVLAVYDFMSDLLRRKVVSDAVYQRAREVVGEAGVIELIGVCGYYTLLAMVLNVAEVEASAEARVPFQPLSSNGAADETRG
jgi:4-carboxymuconolactone decarboxylase